MPWYKTGTVSVTQNSNAVIGAGTAFIANSRVGDGFRGPDGRWYEVTNIASNTALSISPNYEGPPVAGGFYSIMPVQGYQKDLSDQVRAILNSYGEKLAALGTTGNYDILPVEKGGTSGTDQASARVGLGLGTAAVATLQTSPSDSTTGRAMTTGAFGVGGATVPIAEVDLDNARVNGFYNVAASGAGKLPVNVNGYLMHWRNPSTGYAFQTFRPVTGTLEYTRTQVAGTWGSWVNFGSASFKNIGTSGDSVPLLNASNTWSAPQTLSNGTVVGGIGVAPGAAVFQAMSTQGRIILTQGTGLNSIQSVNPANSGYLPLSVVCTNFYNDIDNSANLGNGSKRWATVFAASGTINTSDAREKTAVSEMSQAEINTAMALAKEIGVYRWLDAVANKGDEARLHIGLTVQRAIEVMESFGLEPLKYAFVCHDEWPAIEEQGYESIKGNIYSLGERIYTDVEISMFDQYREYPATFTWEETSREYVVTQKSAPAGDRYGFRYDQLALFIARGQEERIARLEALISPSELAKETTETRQ